MLGAVKSRTRAVAVGKEKEVAFGKMHCSGINGGNDAGINSGVGGRRFTGYMELRYWRLNKDKGEALSPSYLRKN